MPRVARGRRASRRAPAYGRDRAGACRQEWPRRVRRRAARRARRPTCEHARRPDGAARRVRRLVRGDRPRAGRRGREPERALRERQHTAPAAQHVGVCGAARRSAGRRAYWQRRAMGQAAHAIAWRLGHRGGASERSRGDGGAPRPLRHRRAPSVAARDWARPLLPAPAVRVAALEPERPPLLPTGLPRGGVAAAAARAARHGRGRPRPPASGPAARRAAQADARRRRGGGGRASRLRERRAKGDLAHDRLPPRDAARMAARGRRGGYTRPWAGGERRRLVGSW
mmetsp:Transcript_19798/g.64539  ORF Transcript_19798/g.64539 Transcript_19798/m.64539 type:complete len:284 (-) Transcript_19798:18-869(-)